MATSAPGIGRTGGRRIHTTSSPIECIKYALTLELAALGLMSNGSLSINGGLLSGVKKGRLSGMVLDWEGSLNGRSAGCIVGLIPPIFRLFEEFGEGDV